MQARFPATILLGAAGLVFLLAGCSPKIGDSCATSTDCSVNGDRLCDTTQPGGYCTIFNCEPDTCPDEAVCVAFDEHVDPRCPQQGQWSRFERTYCMLRCQSDSDCRAGYVCMDTSDGNDVLGARVVDHSPAGYKICLVPWSGSSPDGPTEVCQPYDGGFPDVGREPPPDAAGASDASSDAADAAGQADSQAENDGGGMDADAEVQETGADGGDAGPEAGVDASATEAGSDGAGS